MTGIIIALIGLLIIAVILTNMRISYVRSATLELIEESFKDVYDAISDNNNFFKEHVNKRMAEINKVEKTDKDYNDSAFELRRWCIEHAIPCNKGDVIEQAKELEMYVNNTPNKKSPQEMYDELIKSRPKVERIKNLNTTE